MDNLFELQGEILMKGVDEVKAQLKEISADVKTTSSTMQDGTAASTGLSKSMSTLASAAVAGAVVIALKKVISTAKELISTYKTASKQQTTLTAVIKATGNQINAYKGEMEDYATELQNLTGISDETIKAAEQVLIATQALDKDGLKRAVADAADLGVAMGTDAASAARTLAIALQDPAEGLTRLKRAGMAFTDTEIAQIKVMQEAGDVAGAQAAVLDKIESKYKGIAQAIGDTPVGTLDKISQMWGDIKEGFGEGLTLALSPALDFLYERLLDIKWAVDYINGNVRTSINEGKMLDIIDAGNAEGLSKLSEFEASDIASLMTKATREIERATEDSVKKYWTGVIEALKEPFLDARARDLEPIARELAKDEAALEEWTKYYHDYFVEHPDELFSANYMTTIRFLETVAEEQQKIKDAAPGNLISAIESFLGPVNDKKAEIQANIDAAEEFLNQLDDMFPSEEALANFDWSLFEALGLERSSKATAAEAANEMRERLHAAIAGWKEEIDELNGAYKPTDYLAEYNKQVAELSLQLLAIDEQIEQAQEAGAKTYLESKREGLIKTFQELVNGGQELEEALDYIREYNEKVADLTDKIAVLDRQIGQTTDPATLRYLEDTRKGLQEELDTLTQIEDVALSWNVKIQTALQDIQSELGSFASETTRLFSNITEAITQPWTEAVTQIDADLKALSESTRKEQDDIKAAYNAGVISYEQYVERTQKAREAAKAKEDELNRQKNEANRKAFEANKANSLAQAVINAAQSITSIWAQYGAQPIVAAALTAISAAATGIEVGTIASQEYVPALARGGIVDKPTIAQIGERGREAIVPLEHNTEWTGGVANALAPVLDGNRRQAERQTELLEKLVDATEKGRVIELDGKRVSKALAPDMNKALGEQYRQTQRGY